MPIALVLGYIGYREQIVNFMQILSHATRAYIWNANGLQGFTDEFDIVKQLRTLQKRGKLEELTKWQVIDIDELEKEL